MSVSTEGPPSGPLPLRGAVVDARRPGAWERVGGIPLVARGFFHLREMGVENFRLLIPSGRDPHILASWASGAEVQCFESGASFNWGGFSPRGEAERFLYLDAAHLVDPRILHTLSVMSAPSLAFIGNSDREKGFIRAGILTGENFRTLTQEGGAPLIGIAKALFPGDIEPFCPRTRGPRTPYFLEIHTLSDAQAATWVLIRNQQKQVMDLPAEYLDPPLENALVYFLCRTPVTPNMVTFLCLAAAIGVGWLFWHGHFLAGALGTLAVEILDGVDGKLAWTKLRFSKLGAHEDVLDYLCENGWYAALGVGLSSTSAGPLPGVLAALLILADTADNLFYTLSGRWYGKSIDLFSPFDGAFRRIAGRRNIYGFMFIVGFALGFHLTTFAAVAAWGMVTAGIHGWRLMQYGRSRRNVLGQA
jgi:phosphatidylglycerophosphate synthase